MNCENFDDLFVFITYDNKKERIVVVYDQEKGIQQPLIVGGTDRELLNDYITIVKEMTQTYGIFIELVQYKRHEVVNIFGSRQKYN